MKKTVFIQSNNKQYLGALLAKYAIEKNSSSKVDFDIRIMNVDRDVDIQRALANIFDQEYLRKGVKNVYSSNDLQSFTLTRFLPPELMDYSGRAIVIDPDIFAISDIQELFNMDMKGAAILACKKNGAWDTSVMLLDCKKLSHWKMSDIAKKLLKKDLDYFDLMSLKEESGVQELDRIWNDLDRLDSNTKMLHTTQRLTQPWKKGLVIDFTRHPLKKILWIIPREWVYKLIGKYSNTYQQHPDSNIESFFLKLLKSAIDDDAIKMVDIMIEKNKKHIRQDIFERLAEL